MTNSIGFAPDTNIIDSAKNSNDQAQPGIALSGKKNSFHVEFGELNSNYLFDLTREVDAEKAREAIDAAIERVKAEHSQFITMFIHAPAEIEAKHGTAVLGVSESSASDDAAGLSVGTGLKISMAALKAAAKTAGQETVVLGVADSAASGIPDGLTRMKKLTIQDIMGSSSNLERGYYSQEFQELVKEQDRLGSGSIDKVETPESYILRSKTSDLETLKNIATYLNNSKEPNIANYTYEARLDSGNLQIKATAKGTTSSASDAIIVIDTTSISVSAGTADVSDGLDISHIINNIQAAMRSSSNVEMGYYDEGAQVAGHDRFIGTSCKALNEAVSKYENLNDDIFEGVITMNNPLNTNFDY